MERRVSSLLLFCCIASTSFSCTKEPENKEPTTSDFEIRFPQDWEAQYDDGDVAVRGLSFRESPGDTYRENIGLVIEPLGKHLTPRRYFGESYSALKNALSQFEAEPSTEVTLNGRDYVRLVYRHRYDGIDSKVVAYFTTKGENGYVLTASASPESYARYEAIFDQVAKSLILK